LGDALPLGGWVPPANVRSGRKSGRTTSAISYCALLTSALNDWRIGQLPHPMLFKYDFVLNHTKSGDCVGFFITPEAKEGQFIQRPYHSLR
jgi:hypothetical protein